MMQAKTYILKLIYNLFMKNLILIPYILASEIFFNTIINISINSFNKICDILSFVCLEFDCHVQVKTS